MVGVDAPQNPGRIREGSRQVNLRTDLAPLADLIEIAFASSMDNNGRAAVREMRTMSNMPGLGLLSGFNTLMQGMGMGYVWIADGRLVGNVSTYPADGSGYDGKTWVIVNVAVHPDYQRRGIAYALMQDSLEMIASRGGHTAILQVDADNPTARRLYQRLGFIEERNWTTWRRSATYTMPPPLDSDVYITHRRASEWPAEYALAEYLRPPALGGLGWLRPLHKDYFHKPFWRQLADWINFKRTERLIIRSQDEQQLLASLWVETSLSATTQLQLLVHPDYEGLYDEALINTAVRRFGTAPLTIEHPSDRAVTSTLLKRYHFVSRREVVHMRWETR